MQRRNFWHERKNGPAGTWLAAQGIRRNTMMSFITRASILSGLVLIGTVAVDSAAPAAPGHFAVRPASRQVTIPAGTILHLRVNRGFGSAISRVEDTVPATLVSPVVIGGRTGLTAM